MKRTSLLTFTALLATLLGSAGLMLSQNAAAPGSGKGKAGQKASDLPYKGKIEKIKVHGKSLEGNLEGDSADRDVFIYLPPSYGSQPNRRYPVVYFLHGYGIGAEAYWNNMLVPQSSDAAQAAGGKEMILVHPDAFTVHNGSMYSNTSGSSGSTLYTCVSTAWATCATTPSSKPQACKCSTTPRST